MATTRVWVESESSRSQHLRGNSVELAPSVWAPKSYVASAEVTERLTLVAHSGTDDQHIVYATDVWGVSVDVEVEPYGLTYARSVKVTMTEPEVGDALVPITTDVLRKVPVAHIVNTSLRQVIYLRYEDGTIEEDPVGNFASMPEGLREHWPNGEQVGRVLHWVQIVYLIADALGDGPTAAVAKSAGVSRATAGRMVAASREAGYLPSADHHHGHA